MHWFYRKQTSSSQNKPKSGVVDVSFIRRKCSELYFLKYVLECEELLYRKQKLACSESEGIHRRCSKKYFSFQNVFFYVNLKHLVSNPMFWWTICLKYSFAHRVWVTMYLSRWNYGWRPGSVLLFNLTLTHPTIFMIN